jgi:MraZ protein
MVGARGSSWRTEDQSGGEWLDEAEWRLAQPWRLAPRPPRSWARPVVSEYLSRHYQTVDEKGRVVLPGKLRRAAEAETGTSGDKLQFYMRDYDGGLSFFTERAWQPMVGHFLQYSNVDPFQRQGKRHFFMGVEKIACDKQGRITIPPPWREKADLKVNVVIIGVGDHFEIWSEERFRRLDAERDARESVEPHHAPTQNGNP